MNFERTGLHKHHCRGCGEGFCNPCSKHQMPVPARGWLSPVRVCNSCKDILSKKYDARPGKQIQNNNFYKMLRIQFDSIYYSEFIFQINFFIQFMKLCDCPQFKNQKQLKFNKKKTINKQTK